MPSVQECVDRLREQAHKTLAPQILALENELQSMNEMLGDGLRSIGYKLEALRHIELPATEPILSDYIREDIRKRSVDEEMLALFTRGLRTKETQEEILTTLLDNAANCFTHVALFSVRGDTFRGWSSRGFSDYTTEAVASDKFLQSDCPVLLKALMTGVQSGIADLPRVGALDIIREESSGTWRLYPLYVFSQPVAVVIAGGTVCKPDAMTVLMDCASLRLENVALKILKALSASASSDTEPVKNSQNTALESSAETAAGIPDSVPQGHEPEKTSNPVPVVAQPEPGQIISDSQSEPVPAEGTLHAVAERFARLLVSEISLYNEGAVAEGRKNRDLYSRLRKEIDRSREMYKKRVAPIVAHRIDYLHEEFVRVLGDGDVSVFGDNYPGPIFEKQTASYTHRA